MAFASDDPLYTVEFLEDNMADFGWFKLVIFVKGEVIESLKGEDLFNDPQR